jgi:hypothetical protein
VELASKLRGQDTADRGFSRACHSDQNYDHRTMSRSRTHGIV